MDKTIVVHTYNVLCEMLSPTSRYTQCDETHCSPTFRFDLLEELLFQHVKKGEILCLQEVGHRWYQALKEGIFNDNSYTVIPCLYGKDKHDNMGVVIAYPNKDYELLEYSHKKIADLFNVPDRQRNLDGDYEPVSQKTKSLWEKANEKPNQVLLCKFSQSSTDREFYIATWHGPCEFLTPQVMEIHINYCSRWLNAATHEKLPLIFAGDFNFTPQSPSYQRLTQSSNQPPLPHCSIKEEWSNSTKMKFMDVYRIMNDGKDPRWTTCGGQDEPFIGVLDYVYLRNVSGSEDNLEPVSCIVEPLLNKGKALLAPNATNPSDHHGITAKFQWCK